MGETITYTADDEEPKCGRCDNIQESYIFCRENCGSAHGRNGYRRTERLDD